MSGFMLRPFAFMRLTHEALRAGFASVQAAADAADLDRTRTEWRHLSEVVALHKRHEEEAFFPLLDARFDDAVLRAGLRDTHEAEEAHEARFVEALDAGDAAAVREALAAWAPSFEAHLVEEEQVMMPLTQQVADTVEGRAAAVQGILAVDWDALGAVHVPYVVRSLAEHKPYGPVRMFVAALQASAGERFAALEPAIRGALPVQTVETLVAHGHLTAQA